MQITKQNACWHITGPITMDSVHAMIDQGEGMPADGALVIDFSDVPEVDSAAIGLIFELLRQAEESHTCITFQHLPAPLLSLATLYGVADLIPQAGH